MRKRGEEHERSKSDILRVARGLVVSRGHHAVSLREIAREAGYSPAALYEYFPSKEDLLATLAAEAAGRLRRALERASVAATEDGDRIVSLGVAYVRFALAHPEDFRLFFEQRRSVRRGLSSAPEGASPYTVLLSAVARAVGSGAIRVTPERDVESMTYGLWAAAHGMATLRIGHLEGFDADLDGADRAALRALVAGFRD